MIDKAFLEISNICNLRCSFCHGTTRKHHMLTDAEFEALTDRLTGKVKFLYFHLLGEPLLHPSFPHFVRRAWEKGFYPILTTNGSLLQKCGQTVLENLPYKISISLHAPAANEAFADPAYFDTCIDFAKQAAAKGCIVVLRLWNVGGEGEAENAAILQKLHTAFPDEWAPSHRDSIRLSRKKEEKIFLEWGEHFEWPDKNAPDVPPDTDIFCHALRDQFGVLCDGTVVPCCLDAEGTLALGNLFDTPLDEILASPRARAIYENFTNRRAIEPLCLRCDYARRFSKK
jgi:radical SAM protein with 4Fe4S-binding SPASM domain